jgi:photosystem II stability/assembly factor-like uncharacterized protein
MTSIIPTYNVQIDSRYRDIQNYPNPTDFAVSFKAPSSTGTYVQGVPINAGTGPAGNGFFSPLQIDPDFNTSEFKVINGTIQNLKAIDADNILACGLVLGTPFSALQGNTVLISSTSSFTYVPLFLIRMSRNQGQWTLNWMIFINQGSSYPIQSTLDNVSRTTFQIDSQNNIFFAFDFKVPQFDLRIVTPEDITTFGSAAQGTTIYTVKNPTDGLKCMAIFSFDQSGDLNYINGHPWGYHILSSNNNIEATMSNGRFNLEIDTALSLYVSGNTNPYKPKIYQTVNSVGSPSYFTSSKLYNYTKPGSSVSYGLQFTSPNDSITDTILLSAYNLDASPPILIKSITIDIGPIFPFASIKGLDFTSTLVGGARNYYFFLYPANNTQSLYFTTVIGYDILTDTMTEYITSGSFYGPHILPGWGTSLVYNPGTSLAYLFEVDYTVPSGQINISRWDPTTPAVAPVFWLSTTFVPWNFPKNLYNFYFGFDSIVYNYSGTDYIYYIVGAISSLNNPSNDPYTRTNDYSIIRLNPVSGEVVNLNFISYGQSSFNFFIRNGNLYLVVASTKSGIYQIDPANLVEPTLLSYLSQGFLVAHPSPYVIDGSYYIIFNLDSQGIVYNIDDMTKPYIINNNSRYPSFDQGYLGSINGIASSGGKTYSYGIMYDSQSPANTWFIKLDWLTNNIEINSGHYNTNLDGYLSIPETNIYSIDTISLNYPNIVSNTLFFNPRTSLGNSLAFWYDPSNFNSLLLVGNKVLAMLDLSFNGLNLVQTSSQQQPIYQNNSLIFDASKQTNMLGRFIDYKSVKYVAMVYSIEPQNNDNYQNIFGIYSSTGTTQNLSVIPNLGIGAYNYTGSNTVSNFNYVKNKNNTYPTTSYNYNIQNGNALSISDFGYDNTNSNVSLFFDGATQNFSLDSPSSTGNIGPGNLINIGGLQSSYLNWSGIASSYDGSKLFACAGTGANENGGYIYSNITGDTWIQSNSIGYKKWSAIAYGSNSSTNSQLLVASVNPGYIYTSYDYGNTWTENVTSGNRAWTALAINNNGGRIFGTVFGGQIYASINSGLTWSALASGSRDWSNICCSSDGVFVYATVNPGYIYKSTDIGVTWSQVTVAGSRNWSSITCSSSGSTVIATDDGGYIYTSDDSGTSWFGGNTTSTNTPFISSLNNNDPNIFLTASVYNSYIFTSTDAGTTWNRQISSGVKKWVATTTLSISSGTLIAGITQDGYVYISENEGTTWTERYKNTNATLSSIVGVQNGAATFIAFAENGGYIYYSTNRGQTWIQATNAGARNWNSLSLTVGTSGNYFIAATDFGGYIYTSINSGVTWTQRVLAGARNWKAISSVLAGSNWYIVATDNGGFVYTSVNGGSTWTQQVGSGSRSWTSITSTLNGANWYMAATVLGGNVYTSIDGGVTWTAQAGSGSRNWSNIVSNSNGTTLYAIVDNSFIYKSIDTGVTWTLKNGSLVKTYKSVSTNGDNTLISAVVEGEYNYVSTNGGFSWDVKVSSEVRNWNKTTVAFENGIIVSTTKDTFIYSSTDSGNTWVKNSPVIYGFFTGIIKEIIGMNVYPNSETRSKIQSYLAYKWNCNTYIANSNPFKQQSASTIYNPMVTKSEDTANISIYNSTNLQNIQLYDTLATTSCSPYKNWSSIAISSSGQYQTAVADNYYIYTSNTYGNSWISTNLMGSWNSVSVSSTGKYQSATNKYGFIYRSSDYGVTWTTTDTARNWISIAVNSDDDIKTPENDGKYQTAVEYGGQIYTSSDYGATWTARDSNRAWISNAINGTGQFQVAVVEGGQIYTSANNGVTWTARDSTRNWRHVDINYTGDIQTAVVYGGQIYVSTDYGATWTTVLTTNWSNITSVWNTSNWLLAASTYDSLTTVDGYIYTSVDNGTNWTERLGAGFKKWTGMSSVYIAPNWYIAAAVVNDLIYISSDNGATWNKTLISNDPANQTKLWNKLTTATDGTNLFIASTVSLPAIGSSGSIYTTTNGGLTWTERTGAGSRLWTDITSVWTGAAWYIAATVDGGNVYTSTDGGATWTQQVGSGSRKWTGITSIWTGAAWYIAATVSNISAFTPDYIYTSTNGGVTWTQQTGIGLGFWLNCSSIWTGAAWYITSVGALNTINTSINGGITWTSRTGPGTRVWTDVTSIWTGAAWYIAATPVPGNIWTSTDGGANWIEQVSSTNKNWNSVSLSKSGTIQAASVYGGQIYESSDSGLTWSAKDSNRLWTHVIVNDSGAIQSASVENSDIYLSNNTGSNWYYNSPVDVYHTFNPYDSNGGYYIFYLDSSGFYIWKCNLNLEFFVFVGEVHYTTTDYQFNTCKLIPYTNSAGTLYFVVLFKNGKAIKYKLSSNGTITNVANASFDLNRNTVVRGALYPSDVLSSGEVYKYDDGNIYLFVLVGSKTFTLNIDLEDTLGYIYFCNITTEGSFIFNSNAAQAYPTVSSNARATAIYKYPNGTPYLILRSIGTPNTTYLNINSYSNFIYPYTNLQLISSAGGAGYQPPVPWIPSELGVYNAISYEDGLAGAQIALDMYKNPVNNSIFSIQNESGDLTSFLYPLDDQQFYINDFDFTNITTAPGNNKFPFYGTWAQVNLSNVGSYYGCAISYSGQYILNLEASGQVFRSSDYGVTFTPVNTIPAGVWFICYISQDKATPSNDGKYQLVIGSNAFIYRSTDFGATFSPITTLGVKNFISGAISNDGVYITIAEFNGFIWRSIDSGNTWNSITTVTVNGNISTGRRAWYIVTMSATGQYQAITSSTDYVYLSNDSGATWANPSTNSVTGIPQGSYFGISMTLDGQNIMVAQVGGFIRQSANYGVVWSPAVSAGFNFWFDVGMSSDPATVPPGKYRVAAPTLDNLFKSNDGGVTYTTVPNSLQGWRNSKVSGTGQYQIATAYNGLRYLSNDFGVTWNPIGNRWNGVAMSSNAQYTTVVDKGGYIYTSSDYSLTFVQRDNPRNWEKVAINQYQAPSAAVTTDVGKYQSATVYGGQIYTSDDYGANWIARDSNRNWKGISIGYSGAYQSAVDYGGQIYTSSDFGVNWIARDSNRPWYDIDIGAILGADDAKYQSAVVNGGHIYTSSDYGSTWTQRASTGNWTSIAISCTGVYQTATIDNGFIYRSVDSGVNWTEITSIGTGAWTSVDMSSNGDIQIAVANNDKIFISTDYGVQWAENYIAKEWTDVAISANGVNKIASANRDFNYNFYSTRSTQITHGTLGQRTYSGSLLTNILNRKAGSLVYFTDLSNPEFATENYRRSNGSYPDPVTEVYTGIDTIGSGFINKLSNEGVSEWLTYYGGDKTNYYGLNTNVSNITIDKSLTYIYAVGGWEQKIQSFYTNSTGTFTQLNQIDSLNSGYNGFVSKIDMIDGSVQWLTPMIGPASDYIEKIQYVASRDEISVISHFDSTILLLYERQTSSTGPWKNPVRTVLNLSNTSVESSSIINLNTDSEYKWHSLLYTDEDSRNVTIYDISVDESNENKTLQIVGVSNANQLECKDSSGTNTQKLYSKIDPFTQNQIFLYGFGVDGTYQHSNKVEFSPNVLVNIQDVKSFSNSNQIYIFPNYKTSANNSSIKIYNRDSSLAKTIPILSSVNPIYNEVNRTCCQPISYLYNPQYVAENGIGYTRIVYQPDGTGPIGISGTTDSLVNYSLYIQGPLLSESTQYSSTTKTLTSAGSILDKNFSIRSNYIDIYTEYDSSGTNTRQRFNIILNQEIDIKNLDRNNLPYQYINGNYTYTEWQGSITKSPINDIIAYDTTLLPNSQNRLTITNLYGTTLTTYTSPTAPGVVPYYIYYPNSSEPGGVKYILVTSVVYNSSTQTYFLTVANLNDLKVNGVYYGPYLYLAKKNVSALYTLQFYPATLLYSRIYYVSVNNLIIPNRPIRNTNLPGVRYLTDLPYVYLSVYNTDDVGNYDSEIVNNFFSNNVTKGFNAVFEIPMKYATINENFVVLSTNSRPKIKFSPGYYNIRCTLTDPDGNILLLDNTPYKPGDIAFTGSTVPDMLMNCNISLVFEPTEFVLTN